jgi:putative membrane protein
MNVDLSAIQGFLSGFDDFLIQLSITLGLFAAALTTYVLLTPHKELELIRQGNSSAALAFGGVILGLAIPLNAALAHAFGIIDLVIWGVVILLIQLIAFRALDMILRDLPARIQDQDVAAALTVFAMKVGVAIILAGAVNDPALNMFRAG